jgi:class 3 adenylate cyclase
MSKRVLVVEDHEENRRILRYLLASGGLEMIEAVTGEEGVAAAERERPDLILMDIQLPGLDGYEATRRIEHEGTLERFTGDGMMIFFNDPVPVPNPAERAVRMALAMREQVSGLVAAWQKRGYDLGLGVGIAQGYATIGAIGFEGRWDYGAIGTVTNLAARLCGEAKGGQILVSSRVAGALEDLIELEEVGRLALKGFSRPIPTFAVIQLR